jgi:5-formyltetrahydrofolate cyclo-ligase
MNETKIARINELAKKSKTIGLTDAEKKEQATLRREFIASVRMNLRTQLDQIDIQEADGSITNLGERYGDKTTH